MDKHREYKTGREELLQTSALVQVQDLLCSQRRHSSKWNQDIKLNSLNHNASIERNLFYKRRICHIKRAENDIGPLSLG